MLQTFAFTPAQAMRRAAITSLLLSPAIGAAAPVDLWSELSFSHSYVINDGVFDPNVEVRLGGTVDVDLSKESSVDDPTAQTTDSSTAQVGDSFIDPPLPFLARGVSTTYVPGGVDRFARSEYDISLTEASEVSPDGFIGPGGVVVFAQVLERTADGAGRAESRSDTGETDTHARATFGHERFYRIENLSNQQQTVNLLGQIEFELTTRARAEAGEARASVSLFTHFAPSAGASVVAMYSADSTTYDQSVSKAFAYANGSADEDGMDFTAFGRSLADPAETQANVSGTAAYSVSIDLDPSAYVVLSTGFDQSSYVDYTVPPATTPPPVPLPASLGFLLMSSLGVFALRR